MGSIRRIGGRVHSGASRPVSLADAYHGTRDSRVATSYRTPIRSNPMAMPPRTQQEHRPPPPFHAPAPPLATPFGSGGLRQVAEKTGAFFGTPVYLITQTLCVIAWIAINAA